MKLRSAVLAVSLVGTIVAFAAPANARLFHHHHHRHHHHHHYR
ncbi:MAG: hypothetical protein ACRYFW_11530 [Janthinobacterium lividum]